MYTDFYKLTAPPFQLSPDIRFFFHSANHRKALAYLTYGINQAEGFVIITGGVGTGKTTLIRQLISELDATRFLVASIVTSQLDPVDTLRMVKRAFGMSHAEREQDKASLLFDIQKFLLTSDGPRKRPILIVDEAQNIPLASLEELRMLSNFLVDHKTGLQIILLGQPQFRAALGSTDLEQLGQRVVASYHLGPLSPEDTAEYILHRLNRVAWANDPELTPGALAAIHRLTQGVPRRINFLCSRTLLYSYLENLHVIDEATVLEVDREIREENETAAAGIPAVAAEGTLALRVASLERQVAALERTLDAAFEIAQRHFGALSTPGPVSATLAVAERAAD